MDSFQLVIGSMGVLTLRLWMQLRENDLGSAKIPICQDTPLIIPPPPT